MPKLTPEELKAARQLKAQQQAETERQAQEEYDSAVNAIGEQRAELERREELKRNARKQRDKIESVVEALYNEIDKLAKKAPREPVTDMTVKMTNQAISALRELLADSHDEFADQIAAIVPAGDLPETRDVLLLLGQMRAALVRFNGMVEQELAQIRDQLHGLRQEEIRLAREDDENEDDSEDDLTQLLKSMRRSR